MGMCMYMGSCPCICSCPCTISSCSLQLTAFLIFYLSYLLLSVVLLLNLLIAMMNNTFVEAQEEAVLQVPPPD